MTCAKEKKYILVEDKSSLDNGRNYGPFTFDELAEQIEQMETEGEDVESNYTLMEVLPASFCLEKTIKVTIR